MQGSRRGEGLDLDRPSVWTGKVSAAVSIDGHNALSSSFGGSFGFTVYLAERDGYALVQDRQVPSGTVLGNMAGTFKAALSTPSEEVSGEGTVSYHLKGTYDPSTQTVSIFLRPSSVDAEGKKTLLGDPARGVPPGVSPLSVKWNTGRRSAMDDSYEDLRIEPLALEAPKAPSFHPERRGDAQLLNSIPMSAAENPPAIPLDLRDPSPQTVTQVVRDETQLGTRTTTWTIALVPLFSIERDDSGAAGGYSFRIGDRLSFHLSIPGVAVRGSQWEDLVSWRVDGQGPQSGRAGPEGGSHGASFAFIPARNSQPDGAPIARGRPVSYRVSASIEGSIQHYFLTQDAHDLVQTADLREGGR